MAEVKGKIIKYLEEQRDINIDALKAYDDKPIDNTTDEVKKMRELEAIKLRHSINELKSYISVINKMFP